MDVRRDAGWASASQGATDMADETTTLRRCIGSARFGIDPHDAPVEDFPRQPSQKDGLGRMCKVHWNQYTAGLARDAKARNAAEVSEPTIEPAHPAPETDSPTEPEPASKRKRPRPAVSPAAGSQGDAE
jgi:hypothetical protein